MDKTSGHAVCVVDDYILDLDRIYDLRSTGKNLGIHKLKSWTNLLERMK